MKTAEFINLFKTGKLGKKRQHSGYKVMDGDHCQLLVRATRRRGVPGGSELIGIYFGSGVCVFHANFNDLRDSVTDNVSAPKPVLNRTVLKESDEHLIESGIIEVDEAKCLMLVEFGETPWLLEHDPKFIPNRYACWNWAYNTGSQLSKRVETIAEAEADTVLPDNQISQIGHLLQVMPSDFVPVSTSKDDVKLLMNPPSPFDYGLTLDDCIVRTIYGGGAQGCVPLYVNSKVVNSHMGAAFKQAAIAYNKATERFKNKELNHLGDLRVDDNGVILIGENEAAYIKGHVYMYNTSERGNFPTWHKVLGKTTKIRLPVR